MGELLVPVGEFLENNHPLLPSPYVEEWHEAELKNRGMSAPTTFMEAVEQCKIYKVAMDPRWVPRGLSDVSAAEIYDFMKDCSVSLCGSKVNVSAKYKDIVHRLNIDIDSDGNLEGDVSNLVYIKQFYYLYLSDSSDYLPIFLRDV